MQPIPVDCREAIQWFVSNFGLYQGSVRGLFLSEFSEEHEASLEAGIINLKSRGFNPLILTGDSLFKQAEYLYEQAESKSSFGRPLASKLEMDLWGSDLVVIKELLAPENQRQLWYLYNYVVYPRLLTGRATLMTTSLGYEEFVRYGAACSDPDFGGRPITWEKLFWLIEAGTVNLELFKQMREEGLPPMLKAEWYLWMSLKERGIEAIQQHVVGDYMLDLAIVEKDFRLDIECDGISSFGGTDRQAEEAKRNLVLLSDGWQILRFTAAEILSNHQGCAEAIEEVCRSGRKKQPAGRWLTGQTVTPVPALPGEDEVQQAAIMHGGGPAAITGGAGTGKTACVIQRVAYLVAQGVNPESILILSHSPDTTKGIKAGIEVEFDKQTWQKLALYSWQELGLKILKENLAAIKRKAPLKIEPNPQKIIQRLLAKHKKDLDTLTLELASGLDEFTVAAVISIYKANLVTPKEVKEKAKDQVEELIAKVYQAYEDQLQRANRVDRDDMVTQTVQMLLDRPEIRAKYQNTYDFVIIDEYQDVTVAEDTLGRLLACPQDNLYLVGDEDEAIYESKGASPKFLSDISFRLPQTRCYTLERNWRSHSAIVDHARQLLSTLGRRTSPKDMVCAFGAAPTSAIVGPQRVPNEQSEADWVADEIQILVDSGRNLKDIAVIYRYHRYGAVFEETLSRRGVRCLASHPEAGLVPDEAEDIMSFLKLVMDPDGPKAKECFERVCQLRSKEVDPKLSSTIASFAEANNLSYLKGLEIYSEATADQSCKELEQLVRIIRTMHQENLPPAETIALVRRTQRLDEYYKSVHVPPGMNYEPLRKLGQIEDEARKFQSVKEFVKHQQGLKQQLTAGGSTDSGVHILTLHEAKGREFPIVFMVGLSEGLFPAENAGDLEEEKRLCYVGFTRARELLYLSFPGMYNNVPLMPSSFLVDARLMPASAPAGTTGSASGQVAPAKIVPAPGAKAQPAAATPAGQAAPAEPAAAPARKIIPVPAVQAPPPLPVAPAARQVQPPAAPPAPPQPAVAPARPAAPAVAAPAPTISQPAGPAANASAGSSGSASGGTARGTVYGADTGGSNPTPNGGSGRSSKLAAAFATL